MIEEDPDIEILGEADNGQSAIDLINKLSPDIAVLDIDMPIMTGLEVMREIKDDKSRPKIIFLTVYADEDIYDEGMELGINGYILKDSAVSDTIDCIHKVNEGKYYISPSVSDFLFNKKVKTKKFSEDRSPIETLTRTELIVLKYISEGMTTKEISEIMNISFKTAENHRSNISLKLHLKGTNSLVKFAIEHRSFL